MSSNVNSTKDKWLLSMIGSTPFVKGKTRLQKYGILIYKEIFNNSEFFNDWQPDKFGMFSRQLAASLERLEKDGYVQVSSTPNYYNMAIKNYRLTDLGKIIKNEWIIDKKDIFDKIINITRVYFNKPLDELIGDTYQKFPDLAKNSTIGAEIRKSRTENSPLLDSEFNLQSLKKDHHVKESASVQEHVFNDEEFRLKLAQSIGFDKIPSLDPKYFDKLEGLFADRMKSRDFDTVELIKESRGY